MTEADKRALDLKLEWISDYKDVAKLQLGLSTGAIVLFVHAAMEFHLGPFRTGTLLIAAMFFGFSTICCIKGLFEVTKVKLLVSNALKGRLGQDKNGPDGDRIQRLFTFMDLFFYAGIAGSVAFMIVQFFASFRN